jgi:integrase/recombinase XerD
MPYTLTTTLSKILLIPNRINLNLINEFHDHMKSKGCSERHRNNTLQVMIGFANFLGRDRTFYDLAKKEQILEFLDTKIKANKQDPDEKWITTWNHYLAQIKLFFRWITNRGGESSYE